MKLCLLPTLIFLFFLTACGDNPQEEALKGIDEALTFLSAEECDKAIKVLEDLEDQDENPVYFKTYASAYACKAAFNMIDFVANDVSAIDDANLLSSMSILSTSDESAVDSAAYVALRSALSILGRADFKQATRNSDFGLRHGEDMGVQVLIYALTEFGKYLNWYGNVDATGKKGAGTNTNSCYLNYSYAAAIAVVTALPGTNACNVANDGHPDLNGAKKIQRMCEGITLVTNIFDVLNTLDLSTSSTLASLEDIVTEINSYRTAADAAGVGYLLDVTSPTACEALLANASDMNNAELLFALVLETEHE